MALAERIQSVRSGLPNGVTLVCVSKFQPVETIQAAYDCGERDFGESRVQELCDKQRRLPADIRWHMIGHLQTNKVKAIVPFVHLIHSVDSLRLLQVIHAEAEKIGRRVDVLLELHVAKESAKSGLLPEELPEVLAALPSLPFVRVRGLMTMATCTEDEAEIHRCFRAVRACLPQVEQALGDGAAERLQLSMGMSGDYRQAVSDGSTMVRVGSAIFGDRPTAEVHPPVVVLDLGGVLMRHDMPRCIDLFVRLMGEENMRRWLGLMPDGEGVPGSLMEQYEQGLVSTDVFVDTVLAHARPQATREEVEQAWLAMHAGIPQQRIDTVRALRDRGLPLYMLSNSNELHWADTCQQLDRMWFDRCFLSFELHASKPAEAVYTEADTYIRQRHPKANILFVDDIQANRVASNHFGWHTFPDLDALVSFLQLS